MSIAQVLFSGSARLRNIKRVNAFVAFLMVLQDRARHRRHLRELDDRLLRDVGLSRADVEHEATKPLWRA